MRSEKGVVKAYQAALRNLADALDIHADITEEADIETNRMAAWLRERATNLALTDQRLLVACAAGEIDAAEERTVTHDLRLAETASRAIAVHEAQAELTHATCARCRFASATHVGFNCRCLCLCAECVAAAGGGILECSLCNDFAEFVRRD